MPSRKPVLAMQKPIEFVKELPLEKIQPNPQNPRKVFREKDINDLCNSIIEMGGIIVPLVVFETEPGEFILLDGERRYRAAKKLRMKSVPANVISGRLSEADNLSTMFNIHMARERWDPASRALALRRLKQLQAKLHIDELSALTGMSKRSIDDAERILSFPDDIIERCLLEGKPGYLRPSNLVEMAKAFEAIENFLPGFFEKHKRDDVSKILIRKRDTNVIPRNTDFRKIKEMFIYLKPKRVQELIERMLTEPDLGIIDIYQPVQDKIFSMRFEHFKSSCDLFATALRKFNFETLDKKNVHEAIRILRATRESVLKELRKLEG